MADAGGTSTAGATAAASVAARAVAEAAAFRNGQTDEGLAALAEAADTAAGARFSRRLAPRGAGASAGDTAAAAEASIEDAAAAEGAVAEGAGLWARRTRGECVAHYYRCFKRHHQRVAALQRLVSAHCRELPPPPPPPPLDGAPVAAEGEAEEHLPAAGYQATSSAASALLLSGRLEGKWRFGGASGGAGSGTPYQVQEPGKPLL
jgi:hypothetical protein